MNDAGNMDQSDTVISELPSGITRPSREPEMALYVISVRNLNDIDGKPISGDALLVRRRGASKGEMLSAVLGCTVQQLPALLTGTGTWTIRELSHVDGYRIRVEPQ